MEYTKFSDFQNKYPTDRDVSHSYTSNDVTSVKYTGIYPQNFINITLESINDVKIGSLKSSNTSEDINFIVRFDGDEWTSNSFKSLLQRGTRENNPYFKKSDVVIVNVDYGMLSTYYSKFKGMEDEANVKVLKTITEKADMFDHISWMVSQSDTIRPVSDFGKWQVLTPSPEPIQKDSFGNTIAKDPDEPVKKVPPLKDNVVEPQQPTKYIPEPSNDTQYVTPKKVKPELNDFDYKTQ